MAVRLPAAARERGFSLVELMIVIAILGLSAAVVAIALPSDSGSARREAERLGARLIAARDRALFAQTETAAIVDADGYRFEERGRDEWRAVTERPLQPRQWQGEVQAVLGDGAPLRIRFDALGLAAPARVQLVSGAGRAVVAVDAAGAVRVE